MSIFKTPELLIDYETTYLAHFQPGPFDVYPRVTAPKVIQKVKAEKPTKLLKDIRTMSDWKYKIPFSFYHQPKEITRTNPNERLQINQFEIKSLEQERKEAQKTRPRIILTPAGALDDLEDDERNDVIKRLYVTTTEKALRSALPDYSHLVADLPGTLSEPRPFVVTSNNVQHPCVSTEWRWETLQWDNQQVRKSCQNSELFWRSRRARKSAQLEHSQ